jgi:lipid-A-disaccharide synthase-like uncharacterized protein
MLEKLLDIDAWVVFGLLGQLFFTARFVVQWVASERTGRSTVPHAFWYFSLAGGSILFLYAFFYRHDLVFSVGQAAGLFIYARNLVLIRRATGETAAPQGAPGPGA